jgi:sulfonate transport system ATP-binding protein
MADELIVDIERRFSSGVVVAAEWKASMRGGTILVLFGPSGAGKTTVVRSIAGLERPELGRIQFSGDTWFDAASNKWIEPQRRHVGYVGQKAALFPHLSVRANVEYGLTEHSATERTRRGDEVLALLDLVELCDRYPRELSGGEAQRVALARALVSEPELILLDEPFASLDAITRVRMHDLVRELRRKHHASMLLVTHDVDEAIALADRIVVMSNGRIGNAHRVELSQADREASVAREGIRAALLADLGLASQH